MGLLGFTGDYEGLCGQVCQRHDVWPSDEFVLLVVLLVFLILIICLSVLFILLVLVVLQELGALHHEHGGLCSKSGLGLFLTLSSSDC